MSRRNLVRRRRGGFTLMEVLLVMAILVILAGMATVFIAKAQYTANLRAAESQVAGIRQILETYHIDMNQYPQTLLGLSQLEGTERQPNKFTGSYLQKPIPLDPWGNNYQYMPVDPDSYEVFSTGPDGLPNTPDDIY